MHAIGGVDFQLYAIFFLRHFIYRGRAKILARIAILHDTFCGAYIQILHDKMTALILFVARAGMIDVRQPVERKLSVALESFGSGAPVDFFVGFVPGVRAHRIDEPASSGDELQSRVKKSAEHSMLKGL